MFVRNSFQFRLCPTKAQAKLLKEKLDECRWLYNELLSQRRLSHEELDLSLSKYQQLMFLPLLEEERPSLKIVHSQVLPNIVNRLDKAFQSFFRRCKAGKKPGFPRFCGMHLYDSFCYPQSGFALLGKEISLSKMGRIRIKMHRSVDGELKTCTIKKTAAGEWDISLPCEVRAVPLKPKTEAIAVDVGIESFATFRMGRRLKIPDFSKRERKP